MHDGLRSNIVEYFDYEQLTDKLEHKTSSTLFICFIHSSHYSELSQRSIKAGYLRTDTCGYYQKAVLGLFKGYVFIALDEYAGSMGSFWVWGSS